jgi:hypothetical protein
MIKHLFISFAILVAAKSFAQEASITLWADQKVFITGEDIWIDGIMQHAKPVSKIAVVQLLDRSGNVKAETEILLENNRISGFISLPNNLPSDYYFIDCYTTGVRSKTSIYPVMVINPNIAPIMGCEIYSNAPSVKSSDINIFTNKENYQPREAVNVSITGLTSIQSSYISVTKHDLLNLIYEQAANGFELEREHYVSKESKDEGKLFKAIVRKEGKLAQGITVIASLKSNTATLAIAKSNENGELSFLFPLKHDASSIVLHPLKSEKGISFELPAGQPTQPINFPCLKINEDCKKDIESRILNFNVGKLFYTDQNRSYKNNTLDTIDFYGRPDVRYYLDEYVRFPNMEEVMAEIIHEVRVKKEKGVAMLQVLNIPFKFFFNNEGLILVDGIPYFNTGELLESDPLLIKSIDVINRKYILGDHEFDGIVHFKTYRNDMGSLKLSDDDKIFSIKVMQKLTALKPSFPLGINQKSPDMRNLIFKKDDIKSDFRGSSTIQFNTSDAFGDYAIIIRGFDKQGKLNTSTKNISISQ